MIRSGVGCGRAPRRDAALDGLVVIPRSAPVAGTADLDMWQGGRGSEFCHVNGSCTFCSCGHVEGTPRVSLTVLCDVTEDKAAQQRASALVNVVRGLVTTRTAADVYRAVVDQAQRTLNAYAAGVVTMDSDGACSAELLSGTRIFRRRARPPGDVGGPVCPRTRAGAAVRGMRRHRHCAPDGRTEGCQAGGRS